MVGHTLDSHCLLSNPHTHSIHGEIKAIPLLLDHGADIDARAKDGRTSLIQASAKGNFDVVQLLVERKANLHAKDNCKFTGNVAYLQA